MADNERLITITATHSTTEPAGLTAVRKQKIKPDGTIDIKCTLTRQVVQLPHISGPLKSAIPIMIMAYMKHKLHVISTITSPETGQPVEIYFDGIIFYVNGGYRKAEKKITVKHGIAANEARNQWIYYHPAIAPQQIIQICTSQPNKWFQ